MKKFNLKQNTAITLIALVITIIVLLILAAITLNLVLGENGIFSKARSSKEEIEYVSAKEALDLKLLEVQAECTKEGKVYDVKEVAKKIELTTEEKMILEKCYYTSISRKKDSTVVVDTISSSQNLIGIVVSADAYPQYKFLIGTEGTIEGIRTEEITSDTKITDYIEIATFETETFGKSLTQSNSVNLIEEEIIEEQQEVIVYSENLVEHWKLTQDLNNSIEGKNALAVYIGNNYSFEDNSIHVENTVVGTASNYSFPSNYTISIKFKPNVDVPLHTQIIGKITGYGVNNEFFDWLKWEDNQKINLYNGTSGEYIIDQSSVYTINSYSTLTYTYDGSNTCFYSNGNLVQQASGGSDLYNRLLFGGSSYSGRSDGGVNWGYANGFYKDLRIYNIALSSEQVKEL